MHPRRYILFALVPLLVACAPQKRLAHLLAAHPELHTDSVVVLRDTIVQHYATHDTIFTLPTGAGALPPSSADDTTGITVVAGNARATLVALGDGRYRLRTEQLRDTVYVETEKTVPCYITKTERVQTPLTGWQQFKMTTGLCALVLIGALLAWIVWRIIRKFIL